MINRKNMLVVGLTVFAGFIGSAQANNSQGYTNVHSEPIGSFIIAREASEGPRGGDNERPGDRQRRGGKHGEEFKQIAALDADLISREASSGGRGKDDPRPHR